MVPRASSLNIVVTIHPQSSRQAIKAHRGISLAGSEGNFLLHSLVEVTRWAENQWLARVAGHRQRGESRSQQGGSACHLTPDPGAVANTLSRLCLLNLYNHAGHTKAAA